MKTHSFTIAASLDDEEVSGATRYEFTLLGRDGVTERNFIVDVPDDPKKSTDVWVVGPEGSSRVAVGDTPEDGFATFTPMFEEEMMNEPAVKAVPGGLVVEVDQAQHECSSGDGGILYKCNAKHTDGLGARKHCDKNPYHNFIIME